MNVRLVFAAALASLCVFAAACAPGNSRFASTPPATRSTAPFPACEDAHGAGWEELALAAVDLRIGLNGQRDFTGGALFAVRIDAEWCLAYMSDAALDEMFSRR